MQSGWATSAVAGSSKAKDGAGTSNESTPTSSSRRSSSETDGSGGAPEGGASRPATTYLRRKSTMNKAQEEAEAKKAQWKIEGGESLPPRVECLGAPPSHAPSMACVNPEGVGFMPD